MNSSNSSLIGAVSGIAILLAVAGLGFYVISLAKAEDIEIPATSYPVSILESEFGSDGVFYKTKQLSRPPVSESVQVGSGDLGKKDIGQFE
ncbi:MAG: hypothetical protein K0S20_739 [Patescibacteria group bacterium]|jgi:hypothetical protein|nr:hypothetical protein [Patescibacteria group bacterium]